MAFYLYGFDASLVSQDSAGNVQPLVTMSVHTTYAGTSPFTATKAVVPASLTPGADTAGIVTADALGRVGFWAENYRGPLFLRQGGNTWPVSPTFDADRPITAAQAAIDATQTAGIAAAGTALTTAVATIDKAYSKVFRVQAIPQGWDESPQINIAIAAANLVGGTVELSEGRHYLDSALTPLAQGVTLRGKGTYTHVFLHSNYTGGPIITFAGKNCTVRDIGIYGGDIENCLGNPQIGAAIDLGTGFRSPTVQDVDFFGVHGWCVRGVATVVAGQTYGKGFYGLMLDRLRGEWNGGGIYINNATTIDRNTQGSISNINLQTNQTDSMMEFYEATDIVISNIDGMVMNPVPQTIKITGGSTLLFSNTDVGAELSAGPGHTNVRIDGAANNVQFNGGILQGGGSAVVISGPGAGAPSGTGQGSVPFMSQCRNISFQGVTMSRGNDYAVKISGGEKIAINGGVFYQNGRTPQRSITDGVTTSGSTTVTSATAAFVASDVGRVLGGNTMGASANVWPTIVTVVSATEVTVSTPAITTSAAAVLTIGVSYEIWVSTGSVVDISRNRFETPAILQDPEAPYLGSGQVTNVLRVQSGNFVTFADNTIIGGHLQAAVFTPGNIPKYIRDNHNYNPVGWYTAANIPVPASGGSTTGASVVRIYYITAAAGGCQVQINFGPSVNPALTVTIPADQCVPVTQPPGTTLKFTYTNAPTMVVYGM